MPNSGTLIALSTALGEDTDYFFRPFSFAIDELQISFRKKSSVGAKDIASLKVQIQDDIERYLEIEDILGITCQKPTNSYDGLITNRTEMIKRAKDVREQWGLGSDCIANVPDMLETHGIKVIYTAAPEGFDGLSGIVNGTHYIIVLNSTKSHIERRRLTAVHELAHLLFNNAFASEITNREREYLCNVFANELLLPEERLLQYFAKKQKIEIKEVITIGKEYGISADAIIYKLYELGIVSEKRFRGYCISKNKDSALKEMVEESRYVENVTNRFEAMVYSALALQLVSESKAASLLGCSVDSIKNDFNVI